VPLKNAIFWDVMPCGSCWDRRFIGKYRLHHQGDKNRRASIIFLRSVIRLLVTASIVPRSPIFVTLLMEAIRSSETFVLTRSTQRNIPEDTILYSRCRENLKSYIALTSCVL
jgi:hypothetical protein